MLSELSIFKWLESKLLSVSFLRLSDVKFQLHIVLRWVELNAQLAFCFEVGGVKVISECRFLRLGGGNFPLHNSFELCGDNCKLSFLF